MVATGVIFDVFLAHKGEAPRVLNDPDLSELLDALRAGGNIDVIRRSVELVLQALMESEATELIGAEPHERSESRTNQRNGHRPRLLAPKPAMWSWPSPSCAEAASVGAAVRTIFAEPDAVHVRSQLGEVAGMLAPQFPQVATMLKDAAEDLLAFTAFPLAHWRKLWWTNPLERVNGEIKGRTNVVGIFPKPRRLRLVTAVCVETHDEWAVAERRYLSEDSMAKMEPSANKAIEDTPITTSKTVTSTITPATLTYTTRAIASETGLVDDSGVCGDIPSAHEWSHAAMEKQSVR